MSMLEWAEKEIEIACKREAPDREEGEWDYGCACYESALKAFKSLMEDEHSGFSIGMTKHILNRLIDGKPLTPIEDMEDVWNYVFKRNDSGAKVHQCRRMSSFFKDVLPDGTVSFHDVNRYVGVNINDSCNRYHSGLVDKVAEELFPITIPYMPESKPYEVYCEDILVDPENGDFDTVGIFYALTPNGERVEINRYFTEGSSEGKAWMEITYEKWLECCKKAAERLKKEAEANENH